MNNWNDLNHANQAINWGTIADDISLELSDYRVRREYSKTLQELAQKARDFISTAINGKQATDDYLCNEHAISSMYAYEETLEAAALPQVSEKKLEVDQLLQTIEDLISNLTSEDKAKTITDEDIALLKIFFEALGEVTLSRSEEILESQSHIRHTL